ncbi:hypothetical protein JXI42_14115 [bacterium]|nr:hypothetical protein [bacterium]
MRTILLCIIFIAALLLISCAAGYNSLEKVPNDEGEIAGFWLGLWHGLIAPVTFIISLFTDKVHFYQVYNNGNWYNIGFILGAGILGQGGFRFIRGKPKKVKKLERRIRELEKKLEEGK